MKKRASISS
jgi:hypothetical protein